MVSIIKLKNQLQQALQYLAQKNHQYPFYGELINTLKKFEQEISDNQLKILLVAQEPKLINEIKNITLDFLAQDYILETALVTDAMNQIEQHYVLILLILDSQQLSQDEVKLLKKSSKTKTYVSILIKENDLEINSLVKEANNIDIFSLSEHNRHQYQLFINSVLNKIIREKFVTIINLNIEQAKKKIWQRIQEDKKL